MKKSLLILCTVFSFAFVNTTYGVSAPLYLQGNPMMTCIKETDVSPFFLSRHLDTQDFNKLNAQQKEFLKKSDITPLSALSINNIFVGPTRETQTFLELSFKDKNNNVKFSLSITKEDLQKIASRDPYLCFLREERSAGAQSQLEITSARFGIQEGNRIVAKQEDGITTVMINGQPAETTISFSFAPLKEIAKVFSSEAFIKVVENLRTNKASDTTTGAPTLLSFYQKLWKTNDLTKPSTNQ